MRNFLIGLFLGSALTAGVGVSATGIKGPQLRGESGPLKYAVIVDAEVMPEPLELSVEPDKTEYKLGEVVQLSFELRNTTENDVTINSCFCFGDGSLTVHVSKDGRDFPEYNPGWGSVDFNPITTVIKGYESKRTSTSALWHSKPNALDRESPKIRAEVAQKTLLTSWAFPAPGRYFVKAVFKSGIDKTHRTLESTPVVVTVAEPTGEDLDAWNRIKDDDKFAFFIQFGYMNMPAFKTEEQAKFRQKLIEIIDAHPHSIYARSLRESLEKFKADEEKRKAPIEKLNPKPPRD